MADKFYFYSKSKDAKVGKGVHEEVRDVSDYSELSKIKDWRKVLSNFHPSQEPFLYKGYHWRSIEHAYQASKIGLVREDLFYQFTIESKSELGLSEDGAAAQKKRKWVVLPADVLKKWIAMSDQVMEEIALAKYSSDEEARAVLLATGKAQLWHLVTRGKPVRFTHLERIRTLLRNA